MWLSQSDEVGGGKASTLHTATQGKVPQDCSHTQKGLGSHHLLQQSEQVPVSDPTEVRAQHEVAGRPDLEPVTAKSSSVCVPAGHVCPLQRTRFLLNTPSGRQATTNLQGTGRAHGVPGKGTSPRSVQE